MLLYWSGSGVTKRIAEKYGGIPLDKYLPGVPFTLIMPSYGSPRTGGYVPPAVVEFLGMHGHNMEAVIGVGNTTFGEDFCYGAKMINWEYRIPLVMMIDMVPTTEQAALLEEIKEKYA